MTKEENLPENTNIPGHSGLLTLSGKMTLIMGSRPRTLLATADSPIGLATMFLDLDQPIVQELQSKSMLWHIRLGRTVRDIERCNYFYQLKKQ